MTIETVSLATALTQLTGLSPVSLIMDGTISGTFSSQYSASSITIENTAGFLGSPTQLANLLTLNFNCGGPGSTGSFNTLNTILNLNKQSANVNQDYVSHTAVAQATVNDNGTSLVPSGQLFGRNANIRITNGATFWYSIIGDEIDVSAHAGSSVNNKIGLQIVQTDLDAVNGSRENIGCLLANAQPAGSGTIGWDIGYCFGAYDGYNPIKSTGTLIGTWAHASNDGTGNMGTVLYGLDLSGYTFTGAPIVAQLKTIATVGVTGKTGSVCWDSGFMYVCTATNSWKRAALSTW